jgi:hypothetical protein
MKFFYLVHPYFFAHHHIHRRKIDFLRGAGIKASILSCVNTEMYKENRGRYNEIERQGYVKIFVGDGNQCSFKLRNFLLINALLSRKVVVQVLRNDPGLVVALRGAKKSLGRLRFVMEFEGDQPLELVYQNDYLEYPRPPELPGKDNETEYLQLLESNKSMMKACDGAVLVSNEHRDLWNARLGKALNVCVFPTIPQPGEIRFDPAQRKLIRSRLGIADKTVLTYSGNVVCKWQRLDAMCGFVKTVMDCDSNVHFLLLVRKDDVALAGEACRFHGIAGSSTIKSVSARDVSSYLSAADVALFLRHCHGMNQIVTSGKICEYLATGLRVITTGANACVINDLIKKENLGYFLDDSLKIESPQSLLAFLDSSKAVSDEQRLCKSNRANQDFASMQIYQKHLNFIRAL